MAVKKFSTAFSLKGSPRQAEVEKCWNFDWYL